MSLKDKIGSEKGFRISHLFRGKGCAIKYKTKKITRVKNKIALELVFFAKGSFGVFKSALADFRIPLLTIYVEKVTYLFLAKNNNAGFRIKGRCIID